MEEGNKSFDKKNAVSEENMPIRRPREWLAKIKWLALICVIIYISGFVLTIVSVVVTSNDPYPGHPSGVIVILMGLIAIAVFLIGLIIILVGAIISAIKMRRQ